jgi:hypothetical protein
MTPTSIPWYESEADFKAILSMVPAHEARGASDYSGWVALIDKTENEIKSRGGLPIRVTVKPSAIKRWVEENRTIVCRASIATYAGLMMTNPMTGSGSN